MFLRTKSELSNDWPQSTARWPNDSCTLVPESSSTLPPLYSPGFPPISDTIVRLKITLSLFFQLRFIETQLILHIHNSNNIDHIKKTYCKHFFVCWYPFWTCSYQNKELQTGCKMICVRWIKKSKTSVQFSSFFRFSMKIPKMSHNLCLVIHTNSFTGHNNSHNNLPHIGSNSFGNKITPRISILKKENCSFSVSIVSFFVPAIYYIFVIFFNRFSIWFWERS